MDDDLPASDPLGSVLGRAAFEGATQGLLVLASDGTVLAVNRAFGELFGIEPVELVGRHHTALREDLRFRLRGEFIGPETWVTHRALRGGRLSGVLQRYYDARGGRKFVVRCGATPLVQDGSFTATVLTFEDATAVADELERRVEAGIRAVHDLDEVSARFAYQAGRVVKAAARLLRFSRRRLLEELGDAVPQGVREAYQHEEAMLDAIRRLVDDAIAAAPMFTWGGEPREIDVGRIARKAEEESRKRYAGSPTRVEIGKGMVAEGRPNLVLAALRNLMDHALERGMAEVRLVRKGAQEFGFEMRGGSLGAPELEGLIVPPANDFRQEWRWKAGLGLWVASECLRRDRGCLLVKEGEQGNATLVVVLGTYRLEWR